ncbi:hypothetical protein PN441_13110 [Spirulina major CS-329]|nr:hypothetical protein [Spirulina subsalsa]MDB9504009.1 hypothetical protein [Spirulina major CS-329]
MGGGASDRPPHLSPNLTNPPQNSPIHSLAPGAIAPSPEPP